MPTVELIYFNAGGGHRASALALEAGIRRAGLPWNIRRTNLFDVLDAQGRFRRLTGMDPEDVYNKRLARGWTLGLAQELKLLQGMIRWSHKALVRRLEHHWRAARPDMVVSLVPNFNLALGESVASALPGVPFALVLTDLADYPPHFWIEPGLDQHLICPSPRAVEQARAAGYPAGRIHATSGALIGPQFYDTQPIDRAAERQRLGLAPDRPTGMVLFGGHGSKAMQNIALRLPDTQLILACGRNAALAQTLRALPAQTPRLVLDFTPEVARYMQLADFFIGKPGCGSLSEAVHMQLPPIMVRNAWTMPQERYNTDWVRDQGLGVILPSFRHVAGAVKEVTGNLERYQAALRGLRNRAAFEVPAILSSILAQARMPVQRRRA
ncbi:glycosyltransferase [Ramlibacter sp. H39-3-26]|uniref:glycosyltransferase n=1 Tax=Curvibacter soli TaxID=3031331 RepID=UPI0023DA4ABA|nr:glycosyltransferase [Ramlibacter sp. H39-3-26]MDF1486566.1 glycosyltransferase [Ramlibacter sp. H39-3-26]